MQVGKDMNVVFHPVDAEQDASFIFDNSPNVFVQFGSMLLPDGFFAVFGAKNKMIHYLTVS
jgi:hypothetical protein